MRRLRRARGWRSRSTRTSAGRSRRCRSTACARRCRRSGPLGARRPDGRPRVGQATSSRGTASGSRPPRRSARAARERAPRPVVQMPGRVAKRRPVGAARHVEHSPQRLAGDRHEQVALGAARHLGERVLGVGDVLEHLDRAHQIELVLRERQVPASITRYSRLGAVRAAQPAWIDSSSRSIPTTRRSPSRSAHRCTSTPSPQPTSSSERGSARSNSSSRCARSRSSDGARRGWWSRTCRRCCR